MAWKKGEEKLSVPTREKGKVSVRSVLVQKNKWAIEEKIQSRVDR